MIKLKDILKEFEYGDKLWADPGIFNDTVSQRSRYTGFIERIYNKEFEPNTKEEIEILSAVEKYLEFPESYPDVTKKNLKDLLKLKSKFPHILDPLASKKELKSATDSVYRGMSADINDILKYIEEAHRDPFISVNEMHISIDTEIKSRRQSGFLSMSTDFEIAKKFMSTGSGRNERCAIVTSTPYWKVADRSIWNPDYLNSISGLDEKEFWILGNTIPITSMQVFFPPIGELADKFRGAIERRKLK